MRRGRVYGARRALISARNLWPARRRRRRRKWYRADAATRRHALAPRRGRRCPDALRHARQVDTVVGAEKQKQKTLEKPGGRVEVAARCAQRRGRRTTSVSGTSFAAFVLMYSFSVR